MRARLAGRAGASPLQPWRDLIRLLRKQTVLAESASSVTIDAPAACAAATAVAACLVPSFTLGMTFAPFADLLLIAGLLIAARASLALAAMDAGTAPGRDGGQPDDAARLPGGAGAAAGAVRARTAGGQPRSRCGRRDADRERRGLADRRRPRAGRDVTGGADRRDAARSAGDGSGRTRSCADRGFRRVAAAGLVQPDRRDVPAVRHGRCRRGADRLGGRDHRLADQDAARRRLAGVAACRALAASDWCARRRFLVSRCCSACWPRCSCWPTWGPHDRRGGCGRSAAVDRIVVRPTDRHRAADLRAAGAVRRRDPRRGGESRSRSWPSRSTASRCRWRSRG